MKVREASEDLKTLKRVLDKLKVPFFLNFGVLLGVYREGRILPDDKDIDIGIMGQERRLEVSEALKEAGFTTRHTDKSIPNLYVSGPKLTCIDIHFWKDEGKKSEYYIEGASIYTLPKKFAEFKKIQFLGRKFLIPKKTEEYLEHYYGDWRTPSNKSAKMYYQ